MKSTLSLFLLLINLPALALEINYQGELRLESRLFEDDSVDSTEDQAYGLFARPEITLLSEEQQIQFKLSLVGREGLEDSERSIFYFEDAYLEKDFGEVQVFAGLRVVNWSTAEAFHPSDIINARNFDTQFENAEKLGEPMVGAAAQFDDFGVQAFYMPFLKGPKLTSSQNRVSFFPPGTKVLGESFVDDKGKTLEDTADQWALKATMNKWGGDWSLYWVHHLDRAQALFVPVGNEITPVFTQVDQLGLNLQQQIGDFIVKFEGATRIFDESIQSDDFGNLEFKSHHVWAAGGEYTYGWDAGSETTFLTEAQFIDGVGRADRRSLGLFQRDLLIGFRHAFNDVSSKEFSLIGIADLEISKQIMVSATYSQRLFSSWKVKGGGRFIDAPASTGPVPDTDLRVFDGDNQLFFELSYFF